MPFSLGTASSTGAKHAWRGIGLLRPPFTILVARRPWNTPRTSRLGYPTMTLPPPLRFPSCPPYSPTGRHPELHRRVWALAAPMILSNLSVPLVTLVDSAIAGHLPEARQLAAVAMGGAFYTALLGILAFLRMGTTGFAAQASGRTDGAALRQILLQAGLLGLGLSLLLLLVASLVLDPLLAWLGLDPAFAELAGHFLHLRLLGLPAALLSYAVIGWLLGTQDARTPLVLLLTTNALNLVLVTAFVLGLGAGVQGIALASVLAEWGGVLLGLWLVIRRLRQWPGRVDRTALRRLASWRPLLAVNRDIFIRSLALQAVFLLFAAQGAQLGETTVAANALLLNGLLVTAFALDGLAHAVEALSGHALGARQGAVLRQVLVIAGGWSLLASLVFALAFALFGDLFRRLAERYRRRATGGPRLPALPRLAAVDRHGQLSAGRPLHRRHPRPGDAQCHAPGPAAGLAARLVAARAGQPWAMARLSHLHGPARPDFRRVGLAPGRARRLAERRPHHLSWRNPRAGAPLKVGNPLPRALP
ncbi:putative MATE family efflux protein [Pseudomonas psychrotolerans]|nr:putative MATE family efflux protein [Pseudomonas psychrotolerans]